LLEVPAPNPELTPATGGQARNKCSAGTSAIRIQAQNSLIDLGMASSSVEAAAEEVVMISQSCDFDEFLESVRDRDYLDVIYLADKEATEAERLKYRSRAGKLDPPEACAGYADALKGFIRFMRYGVKSPSMEETLHEGIQAFREATLESYIKSAEDVEGKVGKE
jgi:hypothetical protein